MTTLSHFKESQVTLKYPAEFAHLAPKIIEHECSFRLHGIDSAVANAIVRTLIGELPVKFLDTRFEDIETDDPRFMHETVIMRLRMIPIKQSLKVGTKFQLKVQNKLPFIDTIQTSSFNSPAFNPNITIWGLDKMRSCSITTTVAESYPYVDGYGGLSLATQVVAIPHDVEPLNVYTKVGTPAATANPQVWDFHFFTHGTIETRELILLTLNSLIERIQRVEEFIPIKTIIGDVSIYRIDNESETIGNLFTKTIIDNYNVNSVAYDMDEDTCILRVFADDADEIVNQCIEHLSVVFGSLKKLF